ncbi:MAG: hypothetical protein MSA15_12980 [Clostridium sp.]|nr:hypothetical protein [Clostridium sp.]
MGGTTVVSAVSGTNNGTYSKYLNVNDQVIMTYTKDSSASVSGESVAVTITKGFPSYD